MFDPRTVAYRQEEHFRLPEWAASPRAQQCPRRRPAKTSASCPRASTPRPPQHHRPDAKMTKASDRRSDERGLEAAGASEKPEVILAAPPTHPTSRSTTAEPKAGSVSHNPPHHPTSPSPDQRPTRRVSRSASTRTAPAITCPWRATNLCLRRASGSATAPPSSTSASTAPMALHLRLLGCPGPSLCLPSRFSAVASSSRVPPWRPALPANRRRRTG